MEEARVGEWAQCGVPHKGWTCVDIEDLGEPSAVCEMCERRKFDTSTTWSIRIRGADSAAVACARGTWLTALCVALAARGSGCSRRDILDRGYPRVRVHGRLDGVQWAEHDKCQAAFVLT